MVLTQEGYFIFILKYFLAIIIQNTFLPLFICYVIFLYYRLYCTFALIIKPPQHNIKINYEEAIRMLDNYNEVLKPDEVRKILSIGRNSMYKLLNSGELAGYRLGEKRWRITKQSVINYIISHSDK